MSSKRPHTTMCVSSYEPMAAVACWNTFCMRWCPVCRRRIRNQSSRSCTDSKNKKPQPPFRMPSRREVCSSCVRECAYLCDSVYELRSSMGRINIQCVCVSACDGVFPLFSIHHSHTHIHTHTLSAASLPHRHTHTHTHTRTHTHTHT